MVPNKFRQAHKNYENLPIESMYGLLCAQQTADLGYGMFRRNSLAADVNTPYMDADLFIDACHYTAPAYSMGLESHFPRDAAKSVHYFEILLEVCMDILNRDRFKSNDLSVICSCWEELVDAYSAGDGCAVDVEKAKDYYKSAFSAAQSNEDIQKQMVIVHTLTGGWPRPGKVYGVLAHLFAMDMVKNSVVEGAALMEEYLYGIREIGEDNLGLNPEQDFALYYKAAGENGNLYACYMPGNCYLKGIGTPVNREEGVRLIRAAAENGSPSAAIQMVYLGSDNEAGWQTIVQRIKADLQSHLAVMQGVTGVQVKPVPSRVAVELHDLYEEEEAEQETAAPEEEEDRSPAYGDTTYDLSRMPSIVYDSGNNRWQRRGIYGDHAVYYNDDGNEVTIWNAEVSGSSDNTSAGTLHWY